jgi:hypothetical protein
MAIYEKRTNKEHDHTYRTLLFDPQANVGCQIQRFIAEDLQRMRNPSKHRATAMSNWNCDLMVRLLREDRTTSTIQYHGSTKGAGHLSMMSDSLGIRWHHERTSSAVFQRKISTPRTRRRCTDRSGHRIIADIPHTEGICRNGD